ncbi:MAG: hypothetical protein GY835_07415 [bacterium]|nr:hypothetical protein [bacterium]
MSGISSPFVIFMLLTTISISPLAAQADTSAAQHVAEVMADSGIPAAKACFREIRSAADDRYQFEPDEFSTIGNTLRISGHLPEAIAFLEMASELSPEVSGSWLALGRVLARNQDGAGAKRCYLKAAELAPGDGGPKQALFFLDLRLKDAELETRAVRTLSPGAPTGLTGPYLGQVPPGLTPEVFAPGIVSTYGGNEYAITFSPDGSELYFGHDYGISVCKLTDTGWSAAEVAGIPGYEMQISPTSGKMYYTADGIWGMDRLDDGWSEPEQIVPEGMFATAAKSGNLYTTLFRASGVIGVYPWLGDSYGEAEELAAQVNSPHFEAHPCVAPDESFIVFDSDKPGGIGFCDLYVTFRQADGTWGTATWLGEEINMPGTNECPSLSPDGKYLFFTSHRDIYWVSSEVLQQVRP